MRIFTRNVLVVIAVALCAASGLWAQESASITGIVTDVTGAVIPNATVILTNPATGQTFKTVTNSIGSYTIPNVPPGPGYKETISHQGFQTAAIDDIYMNVSATRTQNIKLAPGAVSETIAVSASTENVTLNSTDATIGNNFQVQDLNELPVQMRDSPAALMTQQPGITLDGASTGARVDQDRVSLDGLDVNDMTTGAFQTIIANAPVDSVQEFRGTTGGMLSSANAGGGGQFEMVTKSGSNKFHGNINEYHRDTDLEANEWFSNFEGVPRSPLIRNQFGGNFGGPIWKNKVFFFFDYNGRRDTVSGVTERTVPTDSFLKSNIVTYDNTTGGTSSISAAQVQQSDPAGVGFNSQMISVIGGRYPSPNDFTGDKGDLLNTAGFRFNSPTPYTENNYVGKMDINPWQNHHFFGRVTYNKINAVQSAVQFPGDPETHPYLDNSHAWVVGWDWTIGNNKTNSLIWGTNTAKLGFPDITAWTPQGTTSWGWDGDPEGGSFLDAIYPGPGGQSRYFPIPVLRDEFHWSKGRHELTFGGSLKYPTPVFSLLNNFNGVGVGLGGGVLGLTDSDPSGWDARPNDLLRTESSETTFDSAYVFALGRIASYGSTFDYNAAAEVQPAGSGLNNKYKYYEYEFYFGDSWKITPSLTITYGLRYANFTVPYDVHGLESVQNLSFDDFMNARIAQSNAGIGGAASLPGNGADTVPYITYNLGGKANHAPGFFNPSSLNLAPRVAFAWAPTQNRKTVFNGGAGIIYDQTVVNAFLFQETQYNYLFSSGGTLNYGVGGSATHSAQYNSLLQNPRFTALNATLPAPTAPVISRPYSPFIGPQDPNCDAFGASGPCGLNDTGAFNVSVDKNLPTPYSIMYNFGLQQELKGGFILKLSYVGRQGRRLLGQADAEQLIDFPDNISGQKMSQAMANLTQWLRQNPNGNITAVPTQPWFENVLNNIGSGMSNTATVASLAAPYPVRGDFTDTLATLGYWGMLPANVGMAAQFSENTFFTDKGFSGYNGLLTTLHKNAGNGLRFDLNYTWSHSIDNVSIKANQFAFNGYGFICDVLRPRVCRASSDFDVRHYVSGNFTYQLPFGRGRQFGATVPYWTNELIGGWELSGLPSIHSGTPYMANSVAFLMSYSSEDPAILTGTTGPMKSHVTVQNGQVYAFKNYQQAYDQYRGPLAFEIGPRNNLRGPSFFDLDLGLGKTFPVYKERWNLKFRVDAFNALNHPNFESPNFESNMNLTENPNEFGVIPGTVVPNGSDLSARVLQGSLRLEF